MFKVRLRNVVSASRLKDVPNIPLLSTQGPRGQRGPRGATGKSGAKVSGLCQAAS